MAFYFRERGKKEGSQDSLARPDKYGVILWILFYVKREFNFAIGYKVVDCKTEFCYDRMLCNCAGQGWHCGKTYLRIYLVLPDKTGKQVTRQERVLHVKGRRGVYFVIRNYIFIQFRYIFLPKRQYFKLNIALLIMKGNLMKPPPLAIQISWSHHPSPLKFH